MVVIFIKKLRAMGSDSVVIIYSGQGMGSDIREALESGADHYLLRSGDPETEFSELHGSSANPSETNIAFKILSQ